MRGRGGLPRRSQGSEGSSTSEETEISTDIGTLSMEGDHKWQSLLNIKGIVTALQISPDGRWMAYSSLEVESRQRGVFVRPLPDVEEGGRWQVPGGTTGCSWSPSGRELFYFNTENGSLMAIEVETEPTFKFGKSEVLFNPGDIGLGRESIFPGRFDISPEGKRFLTSKRVETPEDESRAEESTTEERRKIIFVVNWFEELKERLPTD